MLRTAEFKKFTTKQGYSLPLSQFKEWVLNATPEQFTPLAEGYNIFHFLLGSKEVTHGKELQEKLKFLFKHAQRLKINPNGQLVYSKGSPSFLDWQNCPLSYCISYEYFRLAHFFVLCAQNPEDKQTNQIKLDLNIVDKGGKTPLMLAIKMATAPLDLIKSLTTIENYNKADHSGMTPIMAAAAMRRTDIMCFLVECHAKNNSDKQIQAVSSFIHQTHPSSGQTLAHFAVLRSGTRIEQLEEDKDPFVPRFTVLNLLKSVGMDGLRDENAPRNYLTTDQCDPVILFFQGTNKFTPEQCTAIGHVNREDRSKTLPLSTTSNLSIMEIAGMKSIVAHLKLTGRSLVESIIARTEETLLFLKSLNMDFSLKDSKYNRSPAEYIKIIRNFKTSKDARFHLFDEKYIYPAEDFLANIQVSLVLHSFFSTSFDRKIQDIIDAYCDPGLINNR